jgi:hypothetical protein
MSKESRNKKINHFTMSELTALRERLENRNHRQSRYYEHVCNRIDEIKRGKLLGVYQGEPSLV